MVYVNINYSQAFKAQLLTLNYLNLNNNFSAFLKFSGNAEKFKMVDPR